MEYNKRTFFNFSQIKKYLFWVWANRPLQCDGRWIWRQNIRKLGESVLLDLECRSNAACNCVCRSPFLNYEKLNKINYHLTENGKTQWSKTKRNTNSLFVNFILLWCINWLKNRAQVLNYNLVKFISIYSIFLNLQQHVIVILNSKTNN